MTDTENKFIINKIMEHFKTYSRTDKRFILQLVNDNSIQLHSDLLVLKKCDLIIKDEDKISQKQLFIVLSQYGANPDRFKVYTRPIKNKITAINELEYYQSEFINKNFYLYEIISKN